MDDIKKPLKDTATGILDLDYRDLKQMAEYLCGGDDPDIGEVSAMADRLLLWADSIQESVEEVDIAA